MSEERTGAMPARLKPPRLSSTLPPLGSARWLCLSGIKLLKYYLDVSQSEQRRRLKDRRKDPLTRWKLSPIDARAVTHWVDYSLARNEMFARTHNR